MGGGGGGGGGGLPLCWQDTKSSYQVIFIDTLSNQLRPHRLAQYVLMCVCASVCVSVCVCTPFVWALLWWLCACGDALPTHPLPVLQEIDRSRQKRSHDDNHQKGPKEFYSISVLKASKEFMPLSQVSLEQPVCAPVRSHV